MCDWNEDGQRDILVGCRNGYTMAYVEEGRGLTLLDTLKTNGGTYIKVGNSSNPHVNDWNEDGKKDLIIGTQDGATGYVRLYINIGTNSNPVFSTYSYIQSNGSPIQWYRNTPRVFDLDQDGLKDLVLSEQSGRIHFYKNVGSNSNPVFNGYESLRLTSGGYIDENQASRIFCVDWNGDGAVDLLTSDFDGWIRYYENTVFPGVEETEHSVISKISVTPNVTRDKLTLKYSLSKKSAVSIEVYSADGRLVDVIDRNDDSGAHELTWHKRDLASGIYFFRLKVNNSEITKKVIVM